MAKYIWAKNKLSNWILEIINKEVLNNYSLSFADLFAWTWAIWSKAKEFWYEIISNDLQYYSYIMNYWKVYLNKTDKNINKYITLLNNLDWIKWFIFENYSEWWKWERLYFSKKNWMKIDAIRIKLEELKNRKEITIDSYNYLLYLLLVEVNKVSNTTSVFSTYLKKIKDTAKNTIELKQIKIIDNKKQNLIYNEDINNLVKKINFEIVYLDPPYNWRQYSKAYHILETIAKYDNPLIKWITWKRDTASQLSNYSKKREVKETFENLIKDLNWMHLFLSYNNEWLLKKEEIEEILIKYWNVKIFEKDYKRFKCNWNKQKQNDVIEYLFYLNKK